MLFSFAFLFSSDGKNQRPVLVSTFWICPVLPIPTKEPETSRSSRFFPARKTAADRGLTDGRSIKVLRWAILPDLAHADYGSSEISDGVARLCLVRRFRRGIRLRGEVNHVRLCFVATLNIDGSIGVGVGGNVHQGIRR